MRDFIEGLDDFKNGNIVRGLELVPVPVQVHTGPKTSPVSPDRQRVPKPHGALSASLK